jgi:hypothetical protein
MKHIITLFCVLAAAQLVAQEAASKIAIKSSDVNNGVVSITAQEGKTRIALQCNKDMPNCTNPAPGPYLMVRLPENHGMYECKNVRVYPPDADPETAKALGEYCLLDAK